MNVIICVVDGLAGFVRLFLIFILDITDVSGISIDVVSHYKTATIGKIDEVASLGAVTLTAFFSSVVIVLILDGVVVLVISRSLQLNIDLNNVDNQQIMGCLRKCSPL